MGLIVLSVYCLHFADLSAQEAQDTIINPTPVQPEKNVSETPLYQGMTIKLDVGALAMALATSEGKQQNYEVAMNWRLKNRFYPTFEVGYAFGSQNKYEKGDSIVYSGQGGFFRVGCDINPLKKHPESPHALLIGIRFGTAVQDYDQRVSGDDTLLTSKRMTFHSDRGYNVSRGGVLADCWGEIVAGCQVEVAKVGNTAFYMGWQGRFRFLFTRKDSYVVDNTKVENGNPAEIVSSPFAHNSGKAIYIPGYGPRGNTAWGLSYYLGWKF
ncbi:MAG: DUF6048 family protein [Paludibacteraceae bacterium]|nr:DUF6048 family protein [Paludibacteraceae bacterium]